MDLLSDLVTSCESTAQALPDLVAAQSRPGGVSLLDVKNELFLSYLQGLALRNLSIIRSIKDGRSFDESKDLNDRLTKKLVEQRVYLEKGVRPLEQRIKYQVDKAVKSAEDEERATAQKLLQPSAKGKQKRASSDGEGESETSSGSASDDDEIDELSYRPNPAAFATVANDDSTTASARRRDDGVYRPPRVAATAMPDVDQREKRERKPQRSHAVDEYVSNELSAAPTTQPSIGSTILAGGRETKSARDLAREAERQEYEETHLVRLPTASKKERAKQKRDRLGLDAEELGGLGDSLDRIANLTRKSKSNALDRSRKRRAVEDGPRDDGIGGAFDVKRKRLERRMKR